MKKYNVTVNGTVYEVEIEEVESFSGASSAPAAKAEAPKSAPAVKAAPAAKTEAPKSAPVSAPAAAGSTVIKAPMAGTIVGVSFAVGQSVKKGDVVAILEAMKMENEIFSPADGVVASVNVSKGASVSAEDVILTLN